MENVVVVVVVVDDEDDDTTITITISAGAASTICSIVIIWEVNSINKITNSNSLVVIGSLI